MKRPAKAYLTWVIRHCMAEHLLTLEEVENAWTAADRHLDEAEVRWCASLEIPDGDDTSLLVVAHAAILALAAGDRATRKMELIAKYIRNPRKMWPAWKSLAEQIEAGTAPPDAMATFRRLSEHRALLRLGEELDRR